MEKVTRSVCARTRSGKAIFEHPISSLRPDLHEAHSDFCLTEHFDAFAVFSFLGDKYALKCGGEDMWAQHYWHQANCHRNVLDRLGAFEQMKNEAGIITVFDLRIHARNLVRPGLRD